MKVRDYHGSGLHDATLDEWRARGKVAAAHAEVAGFTECRETEFMPDGWCTFRPDFAAAECTIGWDTDHLRLAGPRRDCTGYAWLTTSGFYTGTGHKRPGVVATWALLEEQETHESLLRIIPHFPASVQNGDRFRVTQPRRVLAWQLALRGLCRTVVELRHDLRPDEITVSADWNVDLSRAAWRDRINRSLDGTGLRVKAPTEGTLGDRAIDGHASTMNRRPHGVSRVLPRDRGFDHQSVLTILASKESR